MPQNWREVLRVLAIFYLETKANQIRNVFSLNFQMVQRPLPGVVYHLCSISMCICSDAHAKVASVCLFHRLCNSCLQEFTCRHKMGVPICLGRPCKNGCCETFHFSILSETWIGNGCKWDLSGTKYLCELSAWEWIPPRRRKKLKEGQMLHFRYHFAYQ